jgi:DNA-binding MarR family transcriptional regulator
MLYKCLVDLTSAAADLLELVTLVVRDAAGEREQLSLTAVAALGSLERSGAQRITVLAAAEGVSQPSMTQLVHRLEQRGLVRRTADPGDGRVALVSLTTAGARALADRRRRNAERIAGLLADLPDADAGALAGALAAVLPPLRDRLAGGARAPAGSGRTGQ